MLFGGCLMLAPPCWASSSVVTSSEESGATVCRPSGGSSVPLPAAWFACCYQSGKVKAFGTLYAAFLVETKLPCTFAAR